MPSAQNFPTNIPAAKQIARQNTTFLSLGVLHSSYPPGVLPLDTVNFYREVIATKAIKRDLCSLQLSFPGNITAYARADGIYVY